MGAACVAGLLYLAPVAGAQAPAKQAAPAKGEVVAAAIEVTATVTKIDQTTRQVTVKTDDGQAYSFVADSAVKNLAQMKAGDRITAAYTEAVAYEVKKGGTAVGAQTTTAGGSAPTGARPAGAIAQRTTATVTIAAIDAKVPSVTFKSASGETRTIRVLHPEKLQGVSVGDTVELTYSEALAIKVEKAVKK
jgi:Cu/Ag efflux protein CusF